MGDFPGTGDAVPGSVAASAAAVSAVPLQAERDRGTATGACDPAPGCTGAWVASPCLVLAPTAFHPSAALIVGAAGKAGARLTSSMLGPRPWGNCSARGAAELLVALWTSRANTLRVGQWAVRHGRHAPQHTAQCSAVAVQRAQPHPHLFMPGSAATRLSAPSAGAALLPHGGLSCPPNWRRNA